MLIPPHADGGGQQFLDVASCCIATVANHRQVLSTGLELVRVVAGVVPHLALAHIEGGQLGQLWAPAHGGHSSGWLVVGQPAQGQIVAPYVVQAHHMLSLVQIQFDELGCRTGRTLGSPGLGNRLLVTYISAIVSNSGSNWPTPLLLHAMCLLLPHRPAAQ